VRHDRARRLLAVPRAVATQPLRQLLELDGVKKDYAKNVKYATGYVPESTGTTAATTTATATG
jgi:hypothetical protein